MPDPFISIIITIFNKEKTLEDSIKSALYQNYDRKEIIAIDDGSTDGSLKICEKYKNYIKLYSKGNGGQVSAANIGFIHSKGDIIIILDADDLLKDGALYEVSNLWHPDFPLIFWSMEIINITGNCIGNIIPKHFLSNSYEYRKFVERYGYFPGPPQSGYAYNRWFLEIYMPLDEKKWVGGMDGLFAISSVFHGNIKWTSNILAEYRIDQSSVSHSASLSYDKMMVRFMKYSAQYDKILYNFITKEDNSVLYFYKGNFIKTPHYWQLRISLRKTKDYHYPFNDTFLEVIWWSFRSCILSPWIPLRARIGFLTVNFFIIVSTKKHLRHSLPKLRQNGSVDFILSFFKRN